MMSKFYIFTKLKQGLNIIGIFYLGKDTYYVLFNEKTHEDKIKQIVKRNISGKTPTSSEIRQIQSEIKRPLSLIGPYNTYLGPNDLLKSLS